MHRSRCPSDRRSRALARHPAVPDARRFYSPSREFPGSKVATSSGAISSRRAAMRDDLRGVRGSLPRTPGPACRGGCAHLAVKRPPPASRVFHLPNLEADPQQRERDGASPPERHLFTRSPVRFTTFTPLDRAKSAPPCAIFTRSSEGLDGAFICIATTEIRPTFAGRLFSFKETSIR